MGEKPIHKQLLKIVENYISEEIKIAEETGYTDDICEGRREMAVAIQELLANARKEVADV
jgi:lactam utilization protein B